MTLLDLEAAEPAVNLSSLIGKSYYNVHLDIKERKYTHYYFKGGRGSLKSSFISLEIPAGMMRNPGTSAIVLRKVADSLRDSVFNQIQWAIDSLGVSHLWRATISPLAFEYTPTGQKIMFKGADDVKADARGRKLKSLKPPKGTYFAYVWYEELDEFDGAQQIRSLNQSFLRGGPHYCVFYSFNPPKSKRNWANQEVRKERPDKKVLHTTYLTAPRHWLGEQFIAEAEALKRDNKKVYDHEYMGEDTGTGGEVFTNLTGRPITAEERSRFDNMRRGLDFGYGGHPSHYAAMHYDKTRKKLYIYYEYHAYGASYDKLAAAIKKENEYNGWVRADSAEPRSIDEMKDRAVNTRGAKKGPGSVEHGIKSLADLNEIIIDTVTCPNTWREFFEYEKEPDGNGGFKDQYPDENDHSIAAVRYALEEDFKRSGVVLL